MADISQVKKKDQLEESHDKIDDISKIFEGDKPDEIIARDSGINRIHVSLFREFVSRKAKNKLVLSEGNHEMIAKVHKQLKANKHI